MEKLLPPSPRKAPYDEKNIRAGLLTLGHICQRHVERAQSIDELLFFFTRLKKVGGHNDSTRLKLSLAIDSAKKLTQSFDDWRKVFLTTLPYFKSNHEDATKALVEMDALKGEDPQNISDFEYCKREISDRGAKEYLDFLEKNPRYSTKKHRAQKHL